MEWFQDIEKQVASEIPQPPSMTMWQLKLIVSMFLAHFVESQMEWLQENKIPWLDIRCKPNKVQAYGIYKATKQQCSKFQLHWFFNTSNLISELKINQNFGCLSNTEVRLST